MNIYQTSPLAVQQNLFKKGPDQSFSLVTVATDAITFRMFMLGCEKHMGWLVVQKLGFIVELVLEL